MSTVGHLNSLGDDVVLIEVVGQLRCVGSLNSSCVCTGHHPFGCLSYVLDMCMFWGDVACSTPLESAPGHHLVYFTHLLILLIHLAPLHSPGNVQLIILASPLSTWTSVCGCYMAVAFLVCPAIFVVHGVICSTRVALTCFIPSSQVHFVVKSECTGAYAQHHLMSFGEWEVYVGRNEMSNEQF
jgi:hypothetical protein